MNDFAILGIVCVLTLVIYFLPSYIAMARNHKQMVPIFVLNLFLGWTLVGWVVALAWAFTNDASKEANNESPG